MENPEQNPEHSLIHLKPEKVATPEGILRETDVVFDQITGRIVKVGRPDDVRDWLLGEQHRGREVREKFRDGAVMPGLTDAHEHPMMFATLEEIVRPVYCYGLDRDRAIRAIKSHEYGESSFGLPTIVLGFDSAISLSQAELRQIVGPKEAAVFDPSFHGCLVTPEMAASIRKLVTDPEASGFLNSDGRAAEEYALAAIQVAEAYHTIEGIAEAVERKLEHHLEQGITAIHDMLPQTMNELVATLELRKKWKEKRGGMEFPITQFHLRPKQLKELGAKLKELENSRLLTADEIPGLFGLKLLADGALGSYTAKMKEPYAGGKGKGIWFDNLDQINEGLRIARRYGINRVAMHAIGDAGIDRAIDTAKQWVELGEKGNFEPKFRIEHFELPLPLGKTLTQTREVGAWVVPQPNFLLDYVYRDRLDERVRWICPHQRILERGIPMMFGTDGAAGGTDSMLYAIYLATHAVESGQRLSFEQALLASTFAAAHFEGDNRGAIREGYKADIIVADPALLDDLSSGESDVNKETMSRKIAELETKIWRVYKNGQIAKKLR